MKSGSLSLLRIAPLLACILAPLHAQQPTDDYNQPYRPQLHFSPREHWTNDPNGLVYFHGEYHLFFQYNPFGDTWGHMSWGHAVSRDLLHWQELPVALPERDGIMIFTGSAVVDEQNTSGFCDPGQPCLVAIYTGAEQARARQTQNIAYSRDNGRTWTPYAANPVLDLGLADFRDPSVSWDSERHRWLMAVSLPTERKVRFYASPNLKDWTQLSDFGPAGNTAGAWECPDLLRFPADKDHAEMWALKVGIGSGAPQGGSGEQYFLGSFDGASFTQSALPGAHGWTNYGKDDYCAISYNNLPADSPNTLIGWMNNLQYADKLPTSPWRGQMSLPRRITLLHDSSGLALAQEPVIAPLRTSGSHIKGRTSAAKAAVTLAHEEGPFELDLQFPKTAGDTFGIRIYSSAEHWTEIGFDRQRSEFYIDRTHSGNVSFAPRFAARTVAPLDPTRPLDLQLIYDRSSIEAYSQQGTIAMTNLLYPPASESGDKNEVASRIEFFSTSGKPASLKGRLWKLASIWR